MDFEVNDFVVIDNFGDEWTSKIKEIRNSVIKPEKSIYVDDANWFHISKIRKATKDDIDAIS